MDEIQNSQGDQNQAKDEEDEIEMRRRSYLWVERIEERGGGEEENRPRIE